MLHWVLFAFGSYILFLVMSVGILSEKTIPGLLLVVVIMLSAIIFKPTGVNNGT